MLLVSEKDEIKGGVVRPPRATRGGWSHNESCARSRCPRPPRGRGGAGAGRVRAHASLTDRSRSPSKDSEYLAGLRGCSPALALDPPALHTSPRRGPRTPGLRRWARSGEQSERTSFRGPFPDSLRPCPRLSGPGDHFRKPPSSPPHTPPLRVSSSLRIPTLIPDRNCPLPNSLPPTPPTHPFPPRADCRLSQPFSLGFLSRTQPGLSKSCRGTFRSPRPSPKSGQADGVGGDSLHLDIQKLKEKRDLLDKEIVQLISEGYSVDELEDHISQLHEYNDIKDVGQMLLGKLAVIRGVTTKELYPEFGLDVND